MHAAEGILTARGGMTSHAAVVGAAWASAASPAATRSQIDYDGRRCGRRAATPCSRRATPITHRRLDRRGLRGGIACPTVGAPTQLRRGGLRARLHELGRQDPHAQGAHQRRHARTTRKRRAPVRRRGHRPLPHRAHVLRARSASTPVREMILADDTEGARARAREAAADAARRLRRASSARWTGCRSRSACSTRRCTSSCRTTEAEHATSSPPRSASSGEQRARTRRARCTSSTRCSGIRGCRLGITYPEIYEMQVRAIVEAACERDARGRARSSPRS